MSDTHESDSAVAEPLVITRTAPKTKDVPGTETRRQPPYHVIILNDEENSFDYVIELLTKLFGHLLATAEELTLRIHHTGRAIVYTTHREKAELKRDQVLGYGPDPRMAISRGPLGCYIEPAPTD